MTTRRMKYEVVVDATPEEVWRSLTTAEGLAAWFGTRADADLRVGGKRVVGWANTQELVGEFTEIEPHHKLVVTYTMGNDEVGAEEWLIESGGSTTRLTLIQSMDDAGVDDWEGFYGDIDRGWRLFLASLRHALADALTMERTAECTFVPTDNREDSWARINRLLQTDAEVVEGMVVAREDPPHSLLLVAPDRTLLIDHEGHEPGLVIYIQASTHGGPDSWRTTALEVFSTAGT